jgi:hypothetical protein
VAGELRSGHNLGAAMTRRSTELTFADLQSAIARIMPRVDENGPLPPNPFKPVEGNCWIWTGGKTPAGYGSISINNTTFMVHDIVYVTQNGAVLVNDHGQHDRSRP